MKKMILFLSMLSVLPALSAENRIPNGDFDQFDRMTGKAAFWHCSIHQQVVEEGPGVTPVLRLCAYYRSGKMWKSNTLVKLKNIPAGTYVFSFQARGKASQFYFFLNPGKGEKGKKRFIRSFPKLKMKVQEREWRKGEYTLTIPEPMKNAVITLEAFFAGKGEYEFIDKVALVKIK